MFGFVKNYIDDYKSYKEEKLKDNLELQESLTQHRIEFEENVKKREMEEERMLKENIVYNEDTNMYHFEVTSEYNGKPHTFSCDERTEESCRNIAPFVILRAHMYKLCGSCGHE